MLHRHVLGLPWYCSGPYILANACSTTRNHHDREQLPFSVFNPPGRLVVGHRGEMSGCQRPDIACGGVWRDQAMENGGGLPELMHPSSLRCFPNRHLACPMPDEGREVVG